MKFIYTGKPCHNYYGHTLTDGCEVDVNGSMIDKLRDNSAFKEIRAKKNKAKAEKSNGDES